MSSSYDVAIVMDSTTLNKGFQGLYMSRDKEKIFSGNEPIEKIDIKSVDWSIDASPTFTLSPPTQAQWDDESTFFLGGTKLQNPRPDMFQVELSKFSVTLNLDQGSPNRLSFSALIFVDVAIKDKKVQLNPLAVLPTNVSNPLSEASLQVVAGIAYAKVADLLAKYTIPNSIAIEGQDFTPPVVAVTGSHLIVASNLVATGKPDISGVTWPEQSLAVLASRNLLTALVNKFSAKIIQKVDNKSVSYNGSNWAGSYSIDGGISNPSIKVDSTLPNIDVSATISATASLGVSWWLVPAACAMESASNLL